MSDTPRTDEEANGPYSMVLKGLSHTLVQSDFARQLERELNAANDRIKRLEEAGDTLKAVNCNLEEAVKGLFNVIDCPCPHGDSVYYCRSCVDALEFARKAKATPHA